MSGIASQDRPGIGGDLAATGADLPILGASATRGGNEMLGRIVVTSTVAVLGLCTCFAAQAAARGSVTPHTGSEEIACPGAGAMIVDEAARLRAAATLLCLVNRRRAAAGVRALRASAPLTAAAAQHSSAMVARHFFGHAGAAGLRRRVVRAGYVRPDQIATLGETLAWGAGTMATPAQLMDAFTESRAHRRTLLYERFRDAGVGITLGAPLPGAGGGPAATVTVDFGRR